MYLRLRELRRIHTSSMDPENPMLNVNHKDLLTTGARNPSAIVVSSASAVEYPGAWVETNFRNRDIQSDATRTTSFKCRQLKSNPVGYRNRWMRVLLSVGQVMFDRRFMSLDVVRSSAR
jgi:hypothetical protein